MKMGQSVPKRRHIKSRRRVITQKKAYIRTFLVCVELNMVLHEQNPMLTRVNSYTGGADKSLARRGRKQATATENFDFHVSYLQS